MKRKHAWDVPENVTIEKIQEIRERITQWAIRVLLMMILLIVGIILIALGDDTKRIGKYVVTIAYLLMMLGVVYMAYLRNIQIKCWAKYQQIHRMDNLPQTNLVGVWLSNETRIAITRDGEAYRVQESISNSRNGAWMTDEQGKTFSKIGDVREYLAQAGFKAGKADFGTMTDEEFQQFLDAHRL